MRPRSLPTLLLALLAATPGARAASIPFAGEVDVFFPALGLVAVVEGAGVAEVNGAGGALGGPLTALRVPAGAFTIAREFPGSGLVGGLAVTAANGTGSFGGFAGGAGGGPMPMLGVARICLFTGCGGSTVVVSLPMSLLGVGGTTTVAGPVAVTLRGAPWTIGSITVSTPGAVSIVGGSAAGPLGLAGTSAQPGGFVQLVTPIFLETSLPGFEDLDGWALLRVALVPEPAPLLFVGAGLVALAAWRPRRGAP